MIKLTNNPSFPLFSFSLITPERIVYQDDVDSVSLPTPDGEITVLTGHIPLVTMLGSGVMKLMKGGTEQFLSCSNGVVKVDHRGMTVLADSADRADELVEADIEKAHEAARKAMTEVRQDSEAFTHMSALLERETARLKTVRRHRGRKASPGSSNS